MTKSTQPSLDELQKRLESAKLELQALAGVPTEQDSRVASRREELKLIIAGLQKQIRQLENGRWIHCG